MSIVIQHQVYDYPLLPEYSNRVSSDYNKSRNEYSEHSSQISYRKDVDENFSDSSFAFESYEDETTVDSNVKDSEVSHKDDSFISSSVILKVQNQLNFEIPKSPNQHLCNGSSQCCNFL